MHPVDKVGTIKNIYTIICTLFSRTLKQKDRIVIFRCREQS